LIAIEYHFEMAAILPAAQVAGELHEVGKTLGLFDPAATPELILSDGLLTGLGMWIRVVSP
jgi:hypothetical protein